jgi:hypothetical protein
MPAKTHQAAKPLDERVRDLIDQPAGRPRAMRSAGTRILSPPVRAGTLDRPADPPEGPLVVTLSNPRRVESPPATKPSFQVDYALQIAPSQDLEWYYRVAAASAGVEETVLFRLLDQPHGTITFAFSGGQDPEPGFDVCFEREPFGKRSQRVKVSKPVTMD